MQHNQDVAIFSEPVAAIHEDAYFIRKLITLGKMQNKIANAMQQTFSELKFPIFPENITAADIAFASNVILSASQMLEEGRRCNGIVCLIDNNPLRDSSLIRLHKAIPISAGVVLQLLIASPNRAIAIGKEFNSGALSIFGFIDVSKKNAYLSFSIHDRRGAAVSFCGELIAAITPEAIFTTNHITGQTAGRDNRDYLIGAALARKGQILTGSSNSYYRFQWTVHCFSWLFRSAWEHPNGGCIIVCPLEEDFRLHVTSRFEISKDQGDRTLLESFQTFVDSMFKINQLPKPLSEEDERLRDLCLLHECEFRRYLEWVGALTRIDGAVIVGSDMELFLFGAKISELNSDHPVLVLDCIGSHEPNETTISSLGGTRHQSAASLVAKIDGSLAFVASQDRRATLLRKRAGEPLCAFINFQYLFDVSLPANLFDQKDLFDGLSRGD